MSAAGGLPRAHGDAVLAAAARTLPGDFAVAEIDAFEASGSGEHLLLAVEKRGMTTAFAARCLAGWAGVEERAIGYAGLKDRHAVTRQRFSIHLPGRDAPDPASLPDGLRVLHQARHARKLPRGALAGNRFELLLREVRGDAAAIDARLRAIAERGVPNYYGEQRFGRDAGNVAAAQAMFAGHRVRRDQRTHLLSAARSELFNRVLAARVAGGSWDRPLQGEVWVLDGSRSVFGPEPWDAALEARLRAFDIHPSGPLWGRGGLRTRDEALALETAVAEAADAAALCRGLEAAGLRQERRALRTRPAHMSWEWVEGGGLRMRFALPAGSYATALLAELGDVHDAHSR